ncbi:MAG: carboxypeptidase regulatory-like domain-containing protein [Gemmatimonadaceae bacterium]|nr:carboxypeptidase regulatory-like domain-containing protein [Gemmatimonadaceae bacterium]
MNSRLMASVVLAGALFLPHARLAAQDGMVSGTVTAPAAGMGGVVVYLIRAASARVPAIAPLSAQIDQRGLRFVPRVIAVSPGSTVSFPNSDPVMHNVFHPSRHGGGFDLGTYPQGERRSFTFDDEGAYVIFCHVHPEMVGYVVVVASPYRAVTDDEGRFKLDGVAPGTYHLRTWHRRLRTQDQVVSVAANGAVRVDLTLEYGLPVEPRSAEQHRWR